MSPTDSTLHKGPREQLSVAAAFILLAALAGPVTSFVSSPLGFGGQYLSPVQTAAGSGLAGASLLIFAVARRESMPSGGHFLALLALFAPQWFAGLLDIHDIRAMSALHETPWGVAFLVALAAPLWLSLLSALQWIPDPVPRVVVGAGIVGIGAVCLVVPGSAYAITPKEIPVAVLHVLLGVLAVLSWAYARPHLARTGTAAAAGYFLLLTALGGLATTPLTQGDAPFQLDWRSAMLPLLLTVLVSAASWRLWFWLLQRMTLAAFSMRALAMWVASIVPGFFLLGFLSWRVDLAAAIGVAALVVALRARVADEQPLALGLDSP